MRTGSAMLVAVALVGCGGGTQVLPSEIVGHQNLDPIDDPGPLTIERTAYVPIYSSLFLSDHAEPIDLAATLSLRNVSQNVPVIITAVDYYDSHGARIRQLIDKAHELGPLESAEFFVSRADRSGGSGANFLVHWGLREPGPDLFVQAVMHGRDANAGVSFVTEGRTVDERRRTKE